MDFAGRFHHGFHVVSVGPPPLVLLAAFACHGAGRMDTCGSPSRARRLADTSPAARCSALGLVDEETSQGVPIVSNGAGMVVVSKLAST